MGHLNIPVILGTGRLGRRSEAVARLAVDELKERGVVTSLIDVADFGLTATATPGAGTSLDVYREMVAAADGFIIVAPEYNHGYPGELKMLLDADYAGYGLKPVGVISVSAGLLGGVRMFEQLIPVLTALRLIVVPGVHVPEVEKALADGRFASASLQDVFSSMVDEVLRLAPELRAVRQRLEA